MSQNKPDSPRRLRDRKLIPFILGEVRDDAHDRNEFYDPELPALTTRSTEPAALNDTRIRIRP